MAGTVLGVYYISSEWNKDLGLGGILHSAGERQTNNKHNKCGRLPVISGIHTLM